MCFKERSPRKVYFRHTKYMFDREKTDNNTFFGKGMREGVIYSYV